MSKKALDIVSYWFELKEILEDQVYYPEMDSIESFIIENVKKEISESYDRKNAKKL